MSDALSGRKKYMEDGFRNEKTYLASAIAVLTVFGLLPVLSAPATHASAESSDGYGDSKSASHPADTLRGFRLIFLTTQNSWAGLTAG